jgi:Mor family transcriptional regulator
MTAMKSNLDWIKDVAIEEVLDGDSELIYRKCGMDVLLSLWGNLPSLYLYVSTKPLNEAKKIYIRKHYNGANSKELANRLNVSIRFVYKVLEEMKDER